jgi:hypothetical protein
LPAHEVAVSKGVEVDTNGLNRDAADSRGQQPGNGLSALARDLALLRGVGSIGCDKERDKCHRDEE